MKGLFLIIILSLGCMGLLADNNESENTSTTIMQEVTNPSARSRLPSKNWLVCRITGTELNIVGYDDYYPIQVYVYDSQEELIQSGVITAQYDVMGLASRSESVFVKAITSDGRTFQCGLNH